MVKLLTLAKRLPGLDRAEFHSRFLEQSRELAGEVPGLARHIVSLVDVPAEEAGLRAGGGEPAFDAVIETWFEGKEAPAALATLLATPPAQLLTSHVYEVEEFTHRPYEQDWPVGERSPGVKSFFLALRHPDMTHDEMARYWGEQHAPLALKIHVGMWRYTRNVVSRPLTPDAPNWDGMAILHFRTAQDLRERFYDSDEGRAAIAADVAKFSGGGRALHTSEYILA